MKRSVDKRLGRIPDALNYLKGPKSENDIDIGAAVYKNKFTYNPGRKGRE